MQMTWLRSPARSIFIIPLLCALSIISCAPVENIAHRQEVVAPKATELPAEAQPIATHKETPQPSGAALGSLSLVRDFVGHQDSTLAVLTELVTFQGDVRNGRKYKDDILSQKMTELINKIDLLAVKENIPLAQYIVTTLESAQRGAILNAQLTLDSARKGMWLKWSERLFLTGNGLRHYYSEILLNGFERAVVRNNLEETQSFFLQLKAVLHRDHERRIISIVRGLDEQSPSYNYAINLLTVSGGPLARRYFYQKLITQPSRHIAAALAKVGLPRISDLIGKVSAVTSPDQIRLVNQDSPTERFVGDKIQDFKTQWTAFKRYFEELKQIPVKQLNARLKWSKLHEEVSYTINLITAEPDEKEKFKRDILQTFRSSAAPWEHSYRHDGIELREGDIVLMQTGPVGGLWETLTQSGSLLSHLTMIHFSDEGLPMTVEMNYGQLLVAPLDLYSDRYTVIRPTGLTLHDRKAIFEAISEMIKSDYQYDFKFELKSADKLYCSELVAAVFNKAGIERAFQTFNPLSSQAASIFSAAGIRTKNFYTQGSYIAGLGFSTHAERLNSDPRDYIRGLLVLEGFSRYISEATSVKLSRHPEAHQLFALATLAQTVTPGVRRALGPPKFLYTALVLDKLINVIEEDARRAQIREPSTQLPDQSSRIAELKSVINRSLEKALPNHLSEIFPKDDHNSFSPAR